MRHQFFGMENHRFRSKIGYRFEGSGRTPPPKTLGSILPPDLGRLKILHQKLCHFVLLSSVTEY